MLDLAYHLSMKRPAPKPVVWLSDTLATLRACPQEVQDEVGYALYLAQIGEKYFRAKPLKGVGPWNCTNNGGSKVMPNKRDHVVGTGNVFADLGYPRPEEAVAKAELAHKITKIIERRRLTQADAAEILDVDQPKISALRRGRLSGFSLDRLVRFLVLLGSDVQIVVKEQPRSRRRARLLVA